MPALTLTDMIKRDDLDPGKTLVMRHTPQGRFRRAVPFIVNAEPALFAVYESAQINRSVIASFRACQTALSFLGSEDGRTIFVSAFSIGEERQVRRSEYERDCRWQRLHRDFGLDTDSSRNPDDRLSIFGHRPLESWRSLVGRLSIEWPGTRSWCRRAHTNTFAIESLSTESDFSERVPAPEDLIVRAPELVLLPPSWRSALSQWRGIYLITVEGEGARYVGAAYGEENLLGRWRAHIAGDLGVTKELSQRSTETFRFSILELLAPNAAMEEVVDRERRWMDRLHTIEYGLNT